MSSEDGPSAVRRYHDGTKHHFNQFARSLGYLDWASQPQPFRSFAGTGLFPLFPSPAFDASGVTPLHPPGDAAYVPRPIAYADLFDPPAGAEPMSAAAIGDLLRHALGLSAWKRYRRAGPGEGVEPRWSLRVNPSSGNLHPTEAYVIAGPMRGLADSAAVYHYAADRHALEQRAAFDAGAWTSACGSADDQRAIVLIALTSIHWREAWKYGERAFRYCQHDLGHAVAALAVAAAMLGWRARLLSAFSHRAIAAMTGIDRDADFADAEREEPACVIAIGPGAVPAPIVGGGQPLVAAIGGGRWSGRASQLSDDHVQWTFIDEVARATEDPGRTAVESIEPGRPPSGASTAGGHRGSDARSLILQRRSAVAFDGQSSIPRASFLAMLARVMPGDAAPWNTLWWTPRVHLALFVHRVDDVAPGLYLLPRCERAVVALRAACGREFLWEAEAADVPLVCLARGDCRRLAARLSCDQEIAADGFFSLGMLAELDGSLAEFGSSFYRHLFWETGVIGQMLYLEAEAAGARATGIGCFFDDPVHDVLGLRGHTVQSLYHFTVGMAVEDARLTTDPGYTWESTRRAIS